jgi:hypothetical protein
VGRELDVLADQALQHRAHVADDVVDVERSRVEHLLAAEGEQLAREVGGSLPGVEDLSELGARGVVGARSAEQGVAVAVDDQQQVVEVVRDAAGQSPDRLHLLRVA